MMQERNAENNNTMYETLFAKYGPLITTQELSLIFKFDHRSIYRLIKNGTFKLRPVQIKNTAGRGDCLRFSTKDVAALVDSASFDSAPPATAPARRRGRPRKAAATIDE